MWNVIVGLIVWFSDVFVMSKFFVNIIFLKYIHFLSKMFQYIVDVYKYKLLFYYWFANEIDSFKWKKN